MENDMRKLIDQVKNFGKTLNENVKKTNTQFGEIKYTWENNFHPDNPNFMQQVFWMGWQKPDNRYSIGYKLEPNGKVKFVKYGEGNIEDEIPNYGGNF